jgi:hypothetical protein
MVLTRCLFVAVVLVAACGGDDGGPPPGSAALQAWEETADQVFEERTLDTSCFNTPTNDIASTTAIAFTTRVNDFQNPDDNVVGATVIAFAGINFATVLDTQTSDANGNVTINLPAGQTRVGFKMTEADYFDTFLLNQYFDPIMPVQTSPSSISMVSTGTGTALPALVGITRTPGTGVLAGALRDCSGNEISNFTATVSSTSCAGDVDCTESPLTGARTFYFGANGLPARNTVEPIASENGLFAVLELPVTATAYVQMWGYVTAADLSANNLSLLSELEVPVIADNIITGSYEFQRTP